MSKPFYFWQTVSKSPNATLGEREKEGWNEIKRKRR